VEVEVEVREEEARVPTGNVSRGSMDEAAAMCRVAGKISS
jgi:hypothetical protein